MKRSPVAIRLAVFMEQWLANPAAQLDFVKLVEAVRQLPSGSANEDAQFLSWVDEQKQSLRRLGVR